MPSSFQFSKLRNINPRATRGHQFKTAYDLAHVDLREIIRSEVSEPVFLRACRGESVAHVPVWFMRQAGRSLPEYRALRANGSLLEAIDDPVTACEITMQPVRRYG